MENVKQVVPFLWVRDLAQSVRFYTDGLGFTITRQWVDDGKLRWCWLELGGAALMLQEFGTEGHHRNVPEGTCGIGVSLYFICDDALELYRKFVSRGVAAKTPAVGNGMWVTEVSDPDGYKLGFESPTSTPEDTVYSAIET